MVDITTNNYQKAIENFFSRYCSYALTVYFQELKGTVENVIPTADARRALINAGLTTQDVVDESGKVIAKRDFLEDGSLDIDFDELATEYFVRTIPGSLVEMEDEKQLRILQQIYVPLSQAMPALANSGNQQALQAATSAMQFIVQKTIELSGSAHSADLTNIFTNGPSDALVAQQNGQAQFEQMLSAMGGAQTEVMRTLAAQQAAQQEQLTMISQSLGALAGQLGIPEQASEAESVNLAV
jgi:hypothetical protein